MWDCVALDVEEGRPSIDYSMAHEKGLRFNCPVGVAGI